MKFKLHIWRQKSPNEKGRMVDYDIDGVSDDSSFLEMLDQLNESLVERGEEPVHFDNDCREGICGACSAVVNGKPHGPEKTTLCQLHMRSFKDGQDIFIEPWRARSFPVIKDLVVDRSAFDRIIQKGGYISTNNGSAPDANAVPIPKEDADAAFDAAACIGCGACVAACKNASAMLFMSAKVAHMAHLPQGQAERTRRVLAMLEQHDDEGFGACTNTYECQAACPKDISVSYIAEMNRDYFKASLTSRG